MEFYAADVEKICGIKRGRLQTWMERSWIIPSIQKAHGSGTKNIFNVIDLVCISSLKKAVESGLSRKTSANYVSYLKEFLIKDGMIDSIFEEVVKPKQKVNKYVIPWHAVLFRIQGEVFYSSLVWSASDIDKIGEDARDAWFDADDIIVINIGKIIDQIFFKISQLKG